MENDNIPYDKSHRIHPLVIACIVVNEGQEDDMKQIVFEHEVYATWTTRARGTSTSLFDEVTGGQLRKAVIFALMRKDTWEVVKRSIASRLNISKLSKGIAYCIPLTGIMSVSVYKMFSNVRFFEKPVESKKQKKIKIIGGKSK
ncbi:MAG: hypothetical protein K6B65_00740 [Bacilli bacterium]|nr:hypothetical protein [Bacilli bacterium]